MANPASVYCEEQGGELDIRTGEGDGEIGVCIFEDGSSCEEWAFYQGECKPGEGQFAAQAEELVLDAVWTALEPNTASHDRGNWDVVEIYQIKGRQVDNRFEGEPAPGCWSGPQPPENGDVKPGRTYWLVQMIPKPAAPVPGQGTPSPTAPPNIPEPFLRAAHFLVDSQSGNIAARKLLCIIY